MDGEGGENELRGGFFRVTSTPTGERPIGSPLPAEKEDSGATSAQSQTNDPDADSA